MSGYNDFANTMSLIERNLRNLRPSRGGSIASNADASDPMITQAVMDAALTTSPSELAPQVTPRAIKPVAQLKTPEELGKEMFWNNFWDKVSDTWTAPNQFATSVLVNLGTAFQETSNLAGGRIGFDEFGENLATKAVKAWDWQDFDEADRLDIGTAFMFAVGQASNFGTNAVRGRIGAAGGAEGMAGIKKLEDAQKQYGLKFTTGSFDIFSKEERSYMSGEQGFNVGTFLTQASNLVGDIATDPTTYLLTPAVGRGVLYGRRLLSENSDLMARELADLTDIAYSKLDDAALKKKHGALWNNLAFAADNNANTISQWKVVREMQGPQKDLFTDLAGQVKDVRDQAKLIAGLEYGDVRALSELAEKYDDVFKLKLDTAANNGGWAQRRVMDGYERNYDFLNDSDAHKEAFNRLYNVAISEKDSFAYRLFAAAEDGVDGDTILRRIQPSRQMSFSGGKTLSKIEQGAALGRAQVMYSSTGTQIVKWLPTGGITNHAINMIRRPFLAADRRVFDIPNIDGLTGTKVVSLLDDIDRLSARQLSRAADGQPSQYDDLLQQWRRATNDSERLDALLAIQQQGVESIGLRYGLDAATAKEYAAQLQAQNLKYQKAQREAATYFNPETGESIVEPLYASQMANKVELVDMVALNRAMQKEAERGLLPTTASAIKDTTASAQQVAMSVQRTWSQLTLLRPARLPREIMQGSLGAFLSGDWYTGVFGLRGSRNGVGLTSREALANTAANAGTAMDKMLTGVKNIVPENIATKELQKTVAQLDKSISQIDNALRDYTDEIIAPLGGQKFDDILANLTENQQMLLFNNASNLTEFKLHHWSGNVSALRGKGIDTTRPIVGFTDSLAAQRYARAQVTSLELASSSSDDVAKAIAEAAASGKTIRVKQPGRREYLATQDELDNFISNPSGFPDFSLTIYNGTNAARRTFSVIGKKVELNYATISQKYPDLLKLLGMVDDEAAFAKYVADEGWIKDKTLMLWAEQNFVGAFVNKDIVIGVPAMMGTGNVSAVREKIIKRIVTYAKKNPEKTLAEAFGLEAGKQVTAKTLSGARQVALGKRFPALLPNDEAASTVAAMRSHREMLVEQRNGLREIMRGKMAKEAALRDTPKARMGTGKISIGDVEIEDGLASIQGQYMVGAIANGSQAIGKSAYAIARGQERVINRVAKPTDPDYFEGWAGIIDKQMRQENGDLHDIVKMFLNGSSEKEVLRFMRSTPAGQRFAREIGATDAVDGLPATRWNLEEWVGEYASSVRTYIPDDRLARELLEGKRPTGADLEDIYGSVREQLPELSGRFVEKTQLANRRDVLNNALSSMNRVLSDLPNQAFFQQPIFLGAYRKSAQARVENFISRMGRTPTTAEINQIEAAARKSALREARKWTYNATNASRAEEAVRLVSPFISAQLWQAKSLAWAASQNPGRLAYVTYLYQKAQDSMPWVDENGEPTEDRSKARAVVLQLSPEFRDLASKMPFMAGLADMEKISLSPRALDPIFGGEQMPFLDKMGVYLPNPFAGGFGPLVSMPVSELIKNDPDNPLLKYLAEDMNVLPFGSSDAPGSLDMLIPGRTAQLLLDRGFQTGEWLTLYNQTLIWEQGQFALGKRLAPPTPDQIKKIVNAKYDLKMSTAFFSPVSTQFKSEFDVARELYSQYRTKYGADAFDRFIVEHGDLLAATISTSKNPYGVGYSVDAVQTLKENQDLVSKISAMGEDAMDLLPMVVNPDEGGEFDANAYNWLRTNSPAPGTPAYLTNLTPAEISQKVDQGMGWAAFRRGMDKIDSFAAERGVSVEEDPALIAAKQELVRAIRLNTAYGENWYAQYATNNSSKYDQRAKALGYMLSDPKWMSENGEKPGVKAISQFMSMRETIREELRIRQESGGTALLSGNPDLKSAYNTMVLEMKTSDIVFADWYNRYFDNDRII